MSIKRGTYDYITEKQTHLKALDMTSMYMADHEPIRWDLVTSVETGGSYRLGISTTQRIKAMHPCGIEMVWFIDLEPRSANGTGTLQLDTEIISEILSKAPESAAKGLQEWVADAIQKLNEQISNQVVFLNRMRETKNLFESALKSESGDAK